MTPSYASDVLGGPQSRSSSWLLWLLSPDDALEPALGNGPKIWWVLV